MTINVRNKGANGEREAADLLQPVVDSVATRLGLQAPRLRRNLMQYAVGGEDLVGLPWYSIEIKRVETLAVATWWEQAVRQAARKAAGATAWDDLARLGWRRLAPAGAEAPGGGWEAAGRVGGAAGVAPALAVPRWARGEVGPSRVAAGGRRLPILLYRQNRKSWRCVMEGCIGVDAKTPAVVEVTAEAFLAWLEADLLARLG